MDSREGGCQLNGIQFVVAVFQVDDENLFELGTGGPYQRHASWMHGADTRTPNVSFRTSRIFCAALVVVEGAMRAERREPRALESNGCCRETNHSRNKFTEMQTVQHERLCRNGSVQSRIATRGRERQWERKEGK
jgi:hypothetical protein